LFRIIGREVDTGDVDAALNAELCLNLREGGGWSHCERDNKCCTRHEYR
jgi:hypothetical protein